MVREEDPFLKRYFCLYHGEKLPWLANPGGRQAQPLDTGLCALSPCAEVPTGAFLPQMLSSRLALLEPCTPSLGVID
jgi:hypothetical protein